MNFESPKWGRAASTRSWSSTKPRRGRAGAATSSSPSSPPHSSSWSAFFLVAGGGKKQAAPAHAGPGAKQFFAAAAPHVTVIVPGRQQVARVINATGTIAARRDMPVGVSGEGGTGRARARRAGPVGRRRPDAGGDRPLGPGAAGGPARRPDRGRARRRRLAQSNLDRAQALVAAASSPRPISTPSGRPATPPNARVRVAQAQLGADPRPDRPARRPRAGGRASCCRARSRPARWSAPARGGLFRIAAGGEMEVLARLAAGRSRQYPRSASTATVTPVGIDPAYPGRGLAGLAGRRSAEPPGHRPRARSPIDREIRPGGFARDADPGRHDRSRRCCPKSAVQSDDKGNFVYIIGKDNKVVRRDVRIGEVNDHGVAIAAGPRPATSGGRCPRAPSSTPATRSARNARAPRAAKDFGPDMNFRNISAWSIRNPVPSLVLFVALTIAGIDLASCGWT